MTLNSKIKVLLTRYLRFQTVTPTSTVNCTDITRVKSKQPAYEIFSIKRRFQQSKSRTPLQGNLRTRLQYRIYTTFTRWTIFLLFPFRILHFFLTFFCFLPELFTAFCPNLGRATAPSPSGSYAHASVPVNKF